ncbi:MAG TPA: hypothetical protein VGM51_06935 [Armatimonadota bacterium]|jgi:hypothetical protein
MGTSKGYDAPTTPQWQKAKTVITNVARRGDFSPERINRVLGEFIGANGGPRSMAHGGGAIGGRRAGQHVAQSMGDFAQRIGQVGFHQALRDAGLERPEDKGTTEIAAFLTDYLSGSATTIDDADARAAASRLLQELMEGLGRDEAEAVLSEALGEANLPELINRYFAYLLYEQFCRVSYDRLAQRIGAEQADAFLSQIRTYIEARLREESQDRDLKAVDWHGPEGSRLSDAICEDILSIFGRGA